MSEISLDGVTKRWGDTVAVDGLTTQAEAGQFLVLLGPSGCGKSTTLRMIAGLEDVSAGRVSIEGRDVTPLPPSRRQISMVFQSYALFPHLSVAENIIFGLRVRRRPAAERRDRLKNVAELVGLTDYLDRKPAKLSGGQRQRVALARAIIAEYPICLMDEPLSNLDAKLRHEMRVEIRELQRRLGMTVVYVTHDQDEAMSLADKVILLRDGRIEQEARPEELYERPASTFAANFIGTPPMNLLDMSTLAAHAGEDAALSALSGRFGRDAILGVRPEAVSIAENTGVPATLIARDYRGADTIVNAEIAGQAIAFRVSGRIEVRNGDTVRLNWSNADNHVFDARTGRRVDEQDGQADGREARVSSSAG